MDDDNRKDNKIVSVNVLVLFRGGTHYRSEKRRTKNPWPIRCATLKSVYSRQINQQDGVESNEDKNLLTKVNYGNSSLGLWWWKGAHM